METLQYVTNEYSSFIGFVRLSDTLVFTSIWVRSSNSSRVCARSGLLHHLHTVSAVYSCCMLHFTWMIPGWAAVCQILLYTTIYHPASVMTIFGFAKKKASRLANTHGYLLTPLKLTTGIFYRNAYVASSLQARLLFFLKLRTAKESAFYTTKYENIPTMIYFNCHLLDPYLVCLW